MSLEYGESRFDGDDALIHREVAGYIPICRIEGAHPESGFDEDFQMEQQANAEFIAAANPATVLALLGDLETAKKRIAELEAEPVSQTCKLNEPSGNYPVTPDSWISCSERMPEIRQTVIGWNGYAVRQCVYKRNEYAKTQKGREPRFETLTGIWHGVTHWMPLPEPPQEAK